MGRPDTSIMLRVLTRISFLRVYRRLEISYLWDIRNVSNVSGIFLGCSRNLHAGIHHQFLTRNLSLPASSYMPLKYLCTRFFSHTFRVYVLFNFSSEIFVCTHLFHLFDKCSSASGCKVCASCVVNEYTSQWPLKETFNEKYESRRPNRCHVAFDKLQRGTSRILICEFIVFPCDFPCAHSDCFIGRCDMRM